MGKQEKRIRKKCVRERCLETKKWEREKRTQETNNPPPPPPPKHWGGLSQRQWEKGEKQSKGQCQGKGHTFHNCRDVKSLGEGNGNPLQYSCLENPHGCRSLVGYSPWGRKESDTTERLHFPSLKSLGGLAPHSPSHGWSNPELWFLRLYFWRQTPLSHPLLPMRLAKNAVTHLRGPCPGRCISFCDVSENST